MQINYIDDNSSERLPEPESFDNIFANIGELRELQHIHTAAMMQLRLKFEILNSEFRVHHHRNPIHHIESRLKSTRSMYNKLVQRGFPTSIESAKKNLTKVPVLKGTVPHEQSAKFGGAEVFIKPASHGTGVVAGGAMRAVLESVGVTDVLAKSKGSSNPHNLVKATILALSEMRDARMVAQNRGVSMEKVFRG